MSENDPNPIDGTVDDAVATAAAACRRAYDERLQHCANEGPTDDDLTCRLPALKSDFERTFEGLVPVIKAQAAKVANRFSNCVEVDEFQQLALIHIYKKIARFNTGNFRAWLSIVQEKLALSECRRKQRASGREVSLDLSGALEFSVESEPVDVTEPTTVLSHELQQAFDQYWQESDSPNDRYKAMFVNGAGCVRQLDLRQLDLLSDVARPLSDWEVKHRDAIARCNIVVFDWTDAHAMEYWQERVAEDQTGEASLAELEAEYDSKLRSNRQNARHNLMRHYWKFLLVDAFWTYANRGIVQREPVEPIDAEALNYSDWTALMSFDGWIGVPSARIWKFWMEQAGLDNDIGKNFCRVFSFPPLPPKEKDKVHFKEEETRNINPSKLKEIQRWLEASDTLVLGDTTAVPPNAYVRTLMSIGAAHRSRVEIPLPWIGMEVQ